MIKWAPPPRPNGLIIKYYLQYRSANREDVCIRLWVSFNSFKHFNYFKSTFFSLDFFRPQITLGSDFEEILEK